MPIWSEVTETAGALPELFHPQDYVGRHRRATVSAAHWLMFALCTVLLLGLLLYFVGMALSHGHF